MKLTIFISEIQALKESGPRQVIAILSYYILLNINVKIKTPTSVHEKIIFYMILIILLTCLLVSVELIFFNKLVSTVFEKFRKNDFFMLDYNTWPSIISTCMVKYKESYYFLGDKIWGEGGFKKLTGNISSRPFDRFVRNFAYASYTYDLIKKWLTMWNYPLQSPNPHLSGKFIHN